MSSLIEVFERGEQIMTRDMYGNLYAWAIDEAGTPVQAREKGN